jgi:PhzF family phenazine biosynthesis protein
VIEPRAVRHVDAFTTRPLEGNPCAVVDGEGLSSDTMQRIALNQHLSETVFLLPPQSADNDAHIRIFTPGRELPFAGHPTIAASHILVSEGHVALKPGETTLRLETGAGVIPVDVGGTPAARLYTMTQAAPEFRPCAVSREAIAAAVGLAPADVVLHEDVSTGLYWRIAQIATLDAMLRVRPDYPLLTTIEHGLAIFCIGAEAKGADIHVRAFAPDAGVPEDPVTGSANGCIAALIAKHTVLPTQDGAIAYVAEQGLEMGQPGRVHARITGMPDALSVEIGGNAVTVLRGDLLLPD